jgi:N-glycosidase YbiA
MVIDRFDGEYRWLSNFWLAPIEIGEWDIVFPSVEHAYQAAKHRLDQPWAHRQQALREIAEMPTPGMAKRAGRLIDVRPDWPYAKLPIMRKLIRKKFEMHHYLEQKLVATGNAELIEGNTWGDTYWGVCRGRGENHLGKLLMEQRQRLAPLASQ